jgi:hypothetical protein
MMPVEVTIEREGRVTVATYLEPLDMKEIVEANDKATREFLQFATKPVHSILDLTRVHKLPSNMLSNSLSMAKKLHPMVGALVVVSESSFINAMSAILSKTPLGRKVITCKTIDEAWEVVDRLLAEESAQPNISSDAS